MSFNRLLLRGLTISALSKQPGDAYAPTIADDAVLDSRLDEIEFDGETLETPLIAVYTDRDQSRLLDRAAGRGARLRTIELRIDLALASFAKTTIDGQTHIEYSLPATDSELEALLDAFEAQVWYALRKPGRPASDAWQSFVIEEISFDSTPMRSAEGNNRLAARQINLELRIPTDCRPAAAIQTGAAQAPFAPDFSSAPWVNPMFQRMAADGRYGALVDVLRLNAGQPTVFLPALTKVGQVVNSVQLATDIDLFTKLGRPNGWMNQTIMQRSWVAPPISVAPTLHSFDASSTQTPTGPAPLYVFDVPINADVVQAAPPDTHFAP